MRRIFAVIGILLIVMFGLAFSVLNADPVDLDLFFADVEVALSVAMVGALMLGAALGGLASLGAVWRRGREIHRLRRQLGYSERQLQAMRRSPLSGSSD
ncbi:lipopolysaccharide assembly protein LapA domain-containing protein [Halorhodospira halochloris]|uniref:Lipopolysaccharide assembly protein A domain-containing protein n=1 Tax=Halorhodospira halochloris TaxID=1052 RepID=A0A0X8X8Z4_HALHR|nr:LapA family protein [Halorhodospira halochloris]MBK1651480.1 hypothetical protein [Halorhodospira halochloris]MCG5530172.1 lipopolysaccharide assembly protein LapA domain-containing protein [Halorhodospira halochloris]MCG5548030.1 lipopolysaccharide assembly protein LapA domain-containing protein [Halorhodospira halochloris]BAU57257.1 hypothetical protein HH1059_05720 [Halorhodospira halochloris]